MTDETAHIACAAYLLDDPSAALPRPALRDETGMEHIARDMREGRFPERSPRQQVPVEAAQTIREGLARVEDQQEGESQ